ncbi:hypothetical protein AMAG_09299, partial [Allomyces macrogynus ATCC 38327]
MIAEAAGATVAAGAGGVSVGGSGASGGTAGAATGGTSVVSDPVTCSATAASASRTARKSTCPMVATDSRRVNRTLAYSGNPSSSASSGSSIPAAAAATSAVEFPVGKTISSSQTQSSSSSSSSSASTGTAHASPARRGATANPPNVPNRFTPLPYKRRSLVKDHQYGLEIRNVAWHDRSENVISTDRKIIRMWNRESGALFTSIEPPNDINDVCVVPDSGLLFVAGEAVQMHTYLVPDLGPAPHFAAFLENLTEEMAETQAAVLYDNYKFVTRKELKKLGLEQVVGTAAAKAYMHGYFIDQRLYERAKLIANPFAFEEYKQQLIKEKLEAKRGSRIAAKPKAKVNSNLAAKLGGTDAVDDRFKAVFENPEFAIDESSDAFKLLNPSTKPT